MWNVFLWYFLKYKFHFELIKKCQISFFMQHVKQISHFFVVDFIMALFFITTKFLISLDVDIALVMLHLTKR